MVQAIRNIETALGDGVKRPNASEEANAQVVQKSILAACPIRKGEVLTADKLTVKRAGGGLSPFCWDSVVGTVAQYDFDTDEAIRL